MFTMGPPFWGAADGDPFWSFVKVLMHFDGDFTNNGSGSISFAESNGAVIAGGNTRFGSGALDCTASVDSRGAGGGTGMGFGTGDFCIECWFYDPAAAGNTYLYLHEAGGGGNTLRIYSPSSGFLTADQSGASPAGSFAYSFATWHHVAITRSGNNWNTWLDGVAVQSWVNSTHNGGASAQLWLGSGSSSGSGLQVIVDDFRLTVGTPRYTAPFTPAGPFPNRGL